MPGVEHQHTALITERIDLWSGACINKNESNHVKLKEPGSCLFKMCQIDFTKDLFFGSLRENPPDLLLEPFRNIANKTARYEFATRELTLEMADPLQDLFDRAGRDVDLNSYGRSNWQNRAAFEHAAPVTIDSVWSAGRHHRTHISPVLPG